MKPRLLDLFCGAGGCSMGYHRAGFDVTGVDIAPQKNYPFTFVQADALEYLAASGKGFDAIHASPPCQRYSVTANIRPGIASNHPDLVAPCRELLIATGHHWVIENVMGAPLRDAALLCGRMFGLRVLRHRLFETSFLLLAPSHPKHPKGSLTNSHRGYSTGESPFVCLAGHNFERKEGEKAMGIDWMGSRRELAQAIPPAYTEFIGKQLMEFTRVPDMRLQR